MVGIERESAYENRNGREREDACVRDLWLKGIQREGARAMRGSENEWDLQLKRMFRNRLIEYESLREMLDVSLAALIRHADPYPSARVRRGSILVCCAPSVLPIKTANSVVLRRLDISLISGHSQSTHALVST